jgi:hypothetical protein
VRAAGQESVRLVERFKVGYQYTVRVRTDMSGKLSPPAVKGKPAPKPLVLRGNSASEYDERVLAVTSRGEVSKTLRVCRRTEVRRQEPRVQQIGLRSSVQRVVLLREGSKQVPFSPDGPLTWGEVDLLRKESFTAALLGLMPARAVRVGTRWTAGTGAVLELTGLERIDEGRLACRLEEVKTISGRRVARVALSGTLRGINEDGPNRQRLVGHYLFDLAGNYLSALQLKGVHSLLDKDGKEVGHLEGRFVLARRANPRCKELADSAIKGLVVEASADNTRLLYDNRGLGVSFQYPRRWRVVADRGSQVALDGDGVGLLVTFDPLARVPTGAAFLRESRGWLEKQKARLQRVVPPARVKGIDTLEHFALQAQMGKERFWMDYYVVRLPLGGATVAARLPMRKDLMALRKEAVRLARSVTIRKRLKAGK